MVTSQKRFITTCVFLCLVKCVKHTNIVQLFYDVTRLFHESLLLRNMLYTNIFGCLFTLLHTRWHSIVK